MEIVDGNKPVTRIRIRCAKDAVLKVFIPGVSRDPQIALA